MITFFEFILSFAIPVKILSKMRGVLINI